VSSFDCNGKNLWLSYYGLLVDGITWYEKHLAAKPLEPHIRDAVVTFKTLLLQKPKRGVFSFAKNIKSFDTWNDYFIQRMVHTGKKDTRIPIRYTLYQERE
jgi:hypothetical protein